MHAPRLCLYVRFLPVYSGEPVRARAGSGSCTGHWWRPADTAAGLDAAFAGAHGAFLMSVQAVGTAPEPTHDLALAAAAARAGVHGVVKLSTLDGGNGDDPIARRQRTAAAVTDPARGFAWTLLRPGRFLSNALQWTDQLRAGDEVAIPLADRAAASVDPADLAQIAALALTTGEHKGAVHEVSGPQSLTPVEESAILGEFLGRDHAPGAERGPRLGAAADRGEAAGASGPDVRRVGGGAPGRVSRRWVSGSRGVSGAGEYGCSGDERPRRSTAGLPPGFG